jgi:hypothetical protein
MASVRALEVFRWPWIDGHATVGVFIHGYGDDDYAGFMVKPTLNSNVPSGAVTVKAQLTEGETHHHVDQTVARTIWVENTSVGPQPFIQARLIECRAFP